MDSAIKQHEERKAASGEDLVDVLLRVQKEDDGGGLDAPLTMETVKAVILVSSLLINFCFNLLY
jgi:hypothetical protein